ncbi:putative RNase III domain-containing protein [Seiridium cardinale]|uniref:RNase III domain-containing protein n=1 Tax=Seiridium cardinale TaxID=138064 RepID=A0ABR2XEJ8_9PEZI
MSKRQFSEFSSEKNAALDSVSRVVRHAEELLRAAQSLKDDIQAGKRQVLALGVGDRLKAITTEISSALEKLDHGATPPSKAIKRDVPVSVTAAPIHIPATIALTPWEPHVPYSQPSMPAILDPGLEQAVFTHAGLTKDPADNYERLEWIGDAYLYLMSSAFIYQTFPRLPAGRCSQYRELLIRNKTLACYTKDYQLDKRLKLPPEFYGANASSVATNKQYAKVLGDVFEAYIAGVILGDSQGLLHASLWVKALWRKELSEELKKEFRERPVVPTVREPAVESQEPAKVRLAQAIGGRGVRIEYKDQGEPKKEKKTGLPWYTVGVFLDGWGVKSFSMGYGSALSKKEAGTKAAQAALDNKKMLARFEQKKKDYDTAAKSQAGFMDWRK